MCPFVLFSPLLSSDLIPMVTVSNPQGLFMGRGEHQNICPGFQLFLVLVEDSSETHQESMNFPASNDSSKETAFNLKLPRRNLLATFTCNACGVRSQRLINRLAYERGTVFIQCSGCSQYHKLVDNLGLVVEYNFKDEISMDPDADQD